MVSLKWTIVGLVLVGVCHAADKPVTPVVYTNAPKATPVVAPAKAAPAGVPAKVSPATTAKATPTLKPTPTVAPVKPTPTVAPAKFTPVATVKATPTVTPTATVKAPPALPKATPPVAAKAAPATTPAASSAQSKKPQVLELIKPATELMSKAQEAYIGSDSKKAIALFREALALLIKLEKDYPNWAPTSTFSPVRFRKAICETEIERVLLEEAQASSRTIAVTDTRDLEKMREERKQMATTNRVIEVTRKLNSKASGEAVDEVAVKADAVAPAEKGVETQAPVKISEELEWAKDMIVVERFADAETALIKVLKKDGENKEARFLIALAKVQQGKSADALIILSDLLEDTPSDEAALLLAAGAHFVDGSYTKAMTLLDTVMKANPRRPDAYLNMAWLLLDMRQDAQADAELYYRQAVKLGLARNRDIERRLGIKQ